MKIRKLLNSINLTLLLLAIVASLSAYILRQFPLGLVLAVVVSVILDLLLQQLKFGKLRFPSSAIITGLIIGSIAPLTVPYYVILVACAIAILTKFLIRYRNNPIFNPAAIGLIASLFLFSLGDEWWATTSVSVYGVLIPLAILLIFASYRSKKIYVSLSFLIVLGLLSLISSASVFQQLTLSGSLNYIFALPLYFAFVMVAELKTSPHRKSEQVLFGAFVGIVTFAFTYLNFPYALLSALLISNLFYFSSLVIRKRRS